LLRQIDQKTAAFDDEMSGTRLGCLFFVLHFFNGHIAEFIGVEDFSAIEALDKLDIVFSCYDPDPGVLANRIHGVLTGSLAGMGQIVFAPKRLSTAIFRQFWQPSAAGPLNWTHV
jgi:hypothetical protein